MNLKIAEIAGREVGVREAGGNNCGRRIRDYQAATWLKPDAWAWCAAFVCWTMKEWLADPAVVKWLNLQSSTPDEWRPRTAAAFGLIGWGESRPKTVEVLRERELARPGDIVVFDFSHCGIVELAQPGGKWINTIEGNTNGAGTRDSESGDGVWRKVRRVDLVQRYLRIRPAR